MNKNRHECTDIAIIGGGPAGMQAALVASRARKGVVVFDDSAPPRNGASRGVHNFLGLDGLLPQEIRAVAWKQIKAYEYAELRKERVIDLRHESDGQFLITGSEGTKLKATKAILAVGYKNIYPDIPGFAECWANTIIECPYCDGYENKDRIWGIVPGYNNHLKVFSKISRSWTSMVNIIIPSDIEIESVYRKELSDLGINMYDGTINRINHTKGRIYSVMLDSGKEIEMGTLLWIPDTRPLAIIHNLVKNIGLALDENGYVVTDDMQRTNVEGLWAAGEVSKCCSNALDSAAEGSRAAKSIISGWSNQACDLH